MAVNRDLIGQAETFDHADRVVPSTWTPARARYIGSKKRGLQMRGGILAERIRLG